MSDLRFNLIHEGAELPKVLLTLRIYGLYGSDGRLLKILSVLVLGGIGLAIVRILSLDLTLVNHSLCRPPTCWLLPQSSLLPFHLLVVTTYWI